MSELIETEIWRAAVMEEDVASLARWESQGCELRCQQANESPMAWALANGKELAARELMKSEAFDPHRRDLMRMSWMHWAALGCPSLILELGRAGAPIEGVDVNGLAPMHIAAQMNHAQAIRDLVALGAAAQKIPGSHQDPIATAISQGQLEAARALRSCGASLDRMEGSKALEAGHASLCEWLMEEGLPFKAIDALKGLSITRQIEPEPWERIMRLCGPIPLEPGATRYWQLAALMLARRAKPASALLLSAIQWASQSWGEERALRALEEAMGRDASKARKTAGDHLLERELLRLRERVELDQRALAGKKSEIKPRL